MYIRLNIGLLNKSEVGHVMLQFYEDLEFS